MSGAELAVGSGGSAGGLQTAARDPAHVRAGITSGKAHAAQALSIRMWKACLATQELLTVYLGIRLGLYEDLARRGAATPARLAARMRIAPRYAQEWLEQQAAAGIVSVDSPRKKAEQRVYKLPAAHCDVLTTSDSPLSRVASILPLGGVGSALPKLLEAYRSGAGVPDAAYGADWRDGHAGANRALFRHELGKWIRTLLPEAHVRLSRDGARAADVGCGAGWASIALARTYDCLRVDGFDRDPVSVEHARSIAAEAGVADRTNFEVRDATDPALAGQYDLVCLFDGLHEMSHPVNVLRACRALRVRGGEVLVMDARVADHFSAPADEIERFQHTTSVLHCLPVCLVEQPSQGTGTMMRPDAVRAFAAEAGFSTVEVLDVEDRFHQLYRLLG